MASQPTEVNVEEHLKFLQCALDEADKCIPTASAFCVGCVITASPNGAPDRRVIIATGYSREYEGNTHAEANALSNLRNMSSTEISAKLGEGQEAKGNMLLPPPPSAEELLRRSDVYTTLEPCSVRKSGLSPCADALIVAGIRRCFIGVGEPDDFVQCEGAAKLKEAGIEVIWVKGLEDQCLKAARRGH